MAAIVKIVLKNWKEKLWPLFMDRFNCFKTTEPLRGDSLLFTTKSPNVLRWKTESALELPSGFEYGTPVLGIQCLNYWVFAPSKYVNCFHFLMPAISYKFRKIYWTSLNKGSRMLILGEKMTDLLQFRQNKNLNFKV